MSGLDSRYASGRINGYDHGIRLRAELRLPATYCIHCALGHSVDYATPQILDLFARTVVDGLGSANIGGAYTITGTAASFDVANGKATIAAAVGAGHTAHLAATLLLDSDQTLEVSVAVLRTGAAQEVQLHSRIVSEVSAEYYRAVVFVGGGGGITAYIQKRVAGSQVTLTGGGSAVDWGRGTIVAGEVLKLRFASSGASPTRLRFKVWRAVDDEPVAWLLDVTDSQASLQVAKPVGFRFFVGAGASGSGLASIDNYRVLPVA